MMERRFVSVSTAAEELNVSPQTIRNWLRIGILKGVRINPTDSEQGTRGKIMISESSVEEAIEKGWI